MHRFGPPCCEQVENKSNLVTSNSVIGENSSETSSATKQTRFQFAGPVVGLEGIGILDLGFGTE